GGALGVGPALAEGKVLDRQLRSFEDPQVRLVIAGPLAVAEEDRTARKPGVQHRASQLLLGEVERAGVLPASADFDVEGHRGRDATAFRRRRAEAAGLA